jgi:hypothetical protein
MHHRLLIDNNEALQVQLAEANLPNFPTETTAQKNVINGLR